MIAAVMATLAEHRLFALILCGLFTRLVAFGLACMTLAIELFVYLDAYPTHITWITTAFLLMYRGTGILSVDYWITITKH